MLVVMANLRLFNSIGLLLQVYGMLMARSTYEGMKLATSERRPFVLTRAGFIGSQKYAATWTGDNISSWEHLHMSISMILQLVSTSFSIKKKKEKKQKYEKRVPHVPLKKGYFSLTMYYYSSGVFTYWSRMNFLCKMDHVGYIKQSNIGWQSQLHVKGV